MPIEHTVSYRNGPQVMVAGLKLRDLGYCRGARVTVTDPMGHPANGSWKFEVSNNEHATLVSRDPPPPAWIQPGVRIRIEIRPPIGPERGTPQPGGPNFPAQPKIEIHTLYGHLARFCEALWKARRDAPKPNDLASLISALQRAQQVPPFEADMMHTVRKVRNSHVHEHRPLGSRETQIVSAAWEVISEWAERQHATLWKGTMDLS